MRSVLVDTSAWVQFFRRKESPAGQIVLGFVEDGSICTTGVVVAELLSGARNNRDKVNLDNILSGVPFLQITEDIWWDVGEYRRKMRMGGYIASLPDAIIAAAAIHYGAQLFTLDSHFDRIAKYLPLSLLK